MNMITYQINYQINNQIIKSPPIFVFSEHIEMKEMSIYYFVSEYTETQKRRKKATSSAIHYSYF